MRPRRLSASEGGHALPGVVAVGASAGGLAAMEALLRRAPQRTGMAFLLLQHHAPSRPTMLVDLIAAHTRLRVVEAATGMALKPDTVYICPAGRALDIAGSLLRVLMPRGAARMRPIDRLFCSAARAYGAKASCIVLSGTGSDGTAGAEAVAAAGGKVIVQTPASAGYAGMPQAVIRSGCPSEVLDPEDMIPRLIQAQRERLKDRPRTLRPEHVRDAMDVLARRCGHDFSLYKQNTIVRRIERRMLKHRLSDGGDYVRLLREDPAEARDLFRELLIDVTAFFRDPEAFKALRRKALPAMLAQRDPATPLRVWVPGCSTGEEAYSIAMCIRASMEGHSPVPEVKVFATDVSSKAIDTARRGIYSEGAVRNVPAAFRRAYLVKHGAGFRVREEIREMMVFSVQDVTKDPPFSRVDLISCRNLLIYMQPGLQRKVLPLFHDSLNDGGILLLGGSETIGGFSDRFRILDRKWKLYQRKGSGARRRTVRGFPSLTPGRPDPSIETAPAERARLSYRAVMERALIDSFSPVAVLVDEKGDIVHVHGRTGPYLEAVSGRATLNILNLAREGLRIDLGMAMRKVFQKRGEVRCPGLRVRTNGSSEVLDLTVRHVADPSGGEHGLALVVFERAAFVVDEAAPSPTVNRSRKRMEQLTEELRNVRNELRRTSEESDAAREELEATNEELQSTNEELQSTNEELETAKEELQSVNEELSSANLQLEEKIGELQRANSDLQNLMASTDIGVLFLDLDRCIRRFTPDVQRVIDLVETDVGRSIDSFAPRMAYDQFQADVRHVLETLQPLERVVLAEGALWYLVHMKPYRTSRNAIDGVVISFMDVTRIRREEDSLQLMAEAARTAEEPFLIIGADERVLAVNAAAQAFLDRPQPDLIGRPLQEVLGPGSESAVRRAMDACARSGSSRRPETVELDGGARNGTRRAALRLRRLCDLGGSPAAFAVSLTPATGMG